MAVVMAVDAVGSRFEIGSRAALEQMDSAEAMATTVELAASPGSNDASPPLHQPPGPQNSSDWCLRLRHGPSENLVGVLLRDESAPSL